MKKSLFAVAVALLMVPLGALADTLIIGPPSTTDPVLLYSNSSFTVTNNPASSNANIATLLLFFSVPTNLAGQFDATHANPSLTYVGTTTMTSSGCANVYDCAGDQFVSQTGLDFTGLDDSLSFKNFTGAAATNSLPVPTSYTILLYSDSSINAKQTVTFTDLYMPQGTFIAGGGLQAGKQGKQGFTAFTDAGFVTTTPEPASLALLTAGILGLGGFVRRRK